MINTCTHKHTNTHHRVSPSKGTCLSMDGVDCTALTHPRLHVEPRGASDWHGDTNGVEQESCWEWQISGCGDAAEVYVGSGSRPSALSFDLQWGTAFDVLIISLNRAQGGWGKESRGEGRGERVWREASGQPKDVSPVWVEDPRSSMFVSGWLSLNWLCRLWNRGQVWSCGKHIHQLPWFYVQDCLYSNKLRICVTANFIDNW